jgi:hypothetical protein
MAATSSTLGASSITCSTSIADMLMPPEIRMSLKRSMNVILPKSSKIPRSPVYSYPCLIDFLVDSSLFQYPEVRRGLRTMISPARTRRSKTALVCHAHLNSASALPRGRWEFGRSHDSKALK